MNAASIGTIGVVSRPLTVYGSLTTPDPIALHELLDRLAASGVTHLAMEASSHGLDQKRLDGVRLAAGAFTNLTRDHMDYHATIEDYLAAKLRLFRDLLPDRRAGRDRRRQRHRAARDRGGAGARARGGHGRREGRDDPARLGRARRIFVDSRSRVRRSPPAPDVSAAGRLPDLERAGRRRALHRNRRRSRRGVSGAARRWKARRGGWSASARSAARRCSSITRTSPTRSKRRLPRLRPFVRGRLVLVFGCGGDRDAGKRPIMGEIAARRADVAIVTDDNPRSENPAAIRAADPRRRAFGASKSATGREAIRAGIAMLADGDALMIAGKGHETGQIVGDEHAAVLRRRRSARGACGGGMTALWTQAELHGRFWRRAERAAERAPSAASRSTAARLRPAISSSPSRATRTTATIMSLAPSNPAPRRRSCRASGRAGSPLSVPCSRSTTR